MAVLLKPKLTIAISVPALIFTACILITYTAKFREHTESLSLAIISDLLITAPLACYLLTRKSTLSKVLVLRVLMAGILLAGALLSKSNLLFLHIIKTWVLPLLEMLLISFISWKFYVASKNIKTGQQQKSDFLTHCRAVIQRVLGNEKLGNIVASEIAVFYYICSKGNKAVDYKREFTCYKENGSILILSTMLALFIIETAGMHLLFMLWNKTAAWVVTSVSLYTCLQLFAHIKALRARPVVIQNNVLILRNGLMGGDAVISLDNISKIDLMTKPVTGACVVKLALIKGLENHNLAIYFQKPIVVIKAFGIKKVAKVLLINIDKRTDFMKAFESVKNSNVEQLYS